MTRQNKIKVDPYTFGLWRLILADIQEYGLVNKMIKVTGLNRSQINQLIDAGYGTEDAIALVDRYILTLQTETQLKMWDEIRQFCLDSVDKDGDLDINMVFKVLSSRFLVKRIQ